VQLLLEALLLAPRLLRFQIGLPQTDSASNAAGNAAAS
jgi:hypothetical protein